ncbi:putative mitotic spindle biogenesis protein [Phaeoacremonium minimum UCRPA7]|uniref:DASH complex subunit SPC19 n=1 Tax=Phaeoacremonium minimum (strain UCR-PA7) TaxID=1286976 RepID=R8BK02_PHAM7|nr:putative mitotic spindle biogenesis protein [Phaeoacremonium minimum UCRPA7]EON99547.1 putative mitotic spindle biogenesis protein [Phaeoacremonium minimum UCRPA7]
MSTQTTTTSSSYGDCVASLRSSLTFLESSVNTLGNGVSDFPRLVSVLKTVRHYELIPQPTLAAAEASLRDEIGPFIELLLDRADRQLERQARRIETLKARSDLNAGRLSQGPASPSPRKHSRSTSRSGRKTLDGEAALRARAVKQRKEALQYSVERLELEVAQKERELRIRLEKT